MNHTSKHGQPDDEVDGKEKPLPLWLDPSQAQLTCEEMKRIKEQQAAPLAMPRYIIPGPGYGSF